MRMQVVCALSLEELDAQRVGVRHTSMRRGAIQVKEVVDNRYARCVSSSTCGLNKVERSIAI